MNDQRIHLALSHPRKTCGGGMGVVYKAEDTRRAARRRNSCPMAETARYFELLSHCFRREARAASALNHANICTIYDIGEGRKPFLCMELLEG